MECGCKIVHEPDDGRTGAPPGLHAHGGQQYHLVIEQCPMHAAAGDMLAALVDIAAESPVPIREMTEEALIYSLEFVQGRAKAAAARGGAA